jgi:hypothetical protein
MSYKVNDTYTVYKHTTPNNKIYIGITSQPTYKRWRKGKGYLGSYFYQAIKKYGWENIKHEILFVNLNKEEAEQKEIQLIAECKSNNRDWGYNIASGGAINLFEHKKGKEAYWYGKHHTQDTKKKISINNARWLKGKKRDEKIVKKITESIINSPNRDYLKKKIYCEETNTIYDSILQTSELIFSSKNHRSAIKKVCDGIYQGHNGYHFKWVINDEILNIKKREFKRPERFIQLKNKKKRT